jgi:hypothetical protein
MRSYGLLSDGLLVFCACICAAASHGSSAVGDPKTSFTLLVESGGKQRTAVVTLKDLV